MQSTIDLNKYLIQVPCITQLTTLLPELTTILVAKLYAPISHRLVTDGNASCCQQFFNVTKAKCKSVIKPHSVADYLVWIAISGINIGISHALIIARF
jgi:hypothetical protein